VETAELEACPEDEHAELASIYRERGLDAATADAVATQLMAKDALGAHARDELGISEISTARPVQAAFTSAATFTAGALGPLLVVLLVPPRALVPAVAAISLLALGILGAIGARAGGASLWRATARVLFWGAMAMAVTAGIGRLAGAVV
jgi:vacuolar iron transporter family protein